MVAETLSLQGHFLTSSAQKYGSDFGTIAFYLNSLLNACGLPDIVWKNYKLQSIHPAHSIVLSIFRNSFANVTKFDKFGRLIVDDNNKIRNFQRIKQLIEEYDDYQIDDIAPGYKLYTFKKIYNSLIEKDSLEIIPTRLCFRDFTLFQMEEFLFNLTPKPNADDLDSSQKGMGILDINENIFIRKYSLKAAKLQLASSHGSLKKIASKNTFEKRSSQTASTVTEEENFGLPPNHRLLKGYNLEDILQEIKCKTSKFNYRYGFVQLYEERWCFQDMNKQLKLDFNDTSIMFNTPRYQDACLDNSISAGPTCKIKEWRDYFANEDYCERSDGVKMIWTKDCFKCYHKDGTLFTTRTEEGYATAETDEFDSLISQSSSHGLEENADEQQAQRLSGGMQKRYKKQTIAVKPSFSLKKFITDEGNEEHETEDTSYISYSCLL
ncbi:hypothetical protein DOY81_012456 [Sarcophaga bullata]|nr:hypothetical protein DOY81_012456 [Sarcophaga bullata]